MKKETSSGGVVYFDNKILLLKKFNGDWVLPKGRIESGETLKNTAVREVFEESGATAVPKQYLGKINYTFNENRDNTIINKTVHWYLMQAEDSKCTPQHEEGFAEAKYISFDEVLNLIKYPDEKNIIKKALEILRG